MLKNFTISLAIITVTSCSQKVNTLTEQGVPYCYSSEVLVDIDGDVNSATILECTDKPRVEHFVKDTGMAEDCRPYDIAYSVKGKARNVQGFLCKFPDGSWQAVDGRYAY